MTLSPRRLTHFCLALFGFPGFMQAQAVLTWHNDNARTGQNQHETILTPANVNSTAFGRLATLSVDGKVDAQPLYVPNLTIPGQGTHNVLYVATENDSLYAFDADTFAQLLHVSVLGTDEVPSDDHSCSQVTPTIGITSTPAIDLSVGPNGTMYLIAMSKVSSSGAYIQRLHALDLTTLNEVLGGPIEIQASFPGNGAENKFNPGVHKERPGLLISGGVVYTSWGSHCDAGSYAGWVISYNETTLAQVGVANLTPNGNDGGIWAAGSGPAADANGNIYVIIGNGTFDTSLTTGFPSESDYGNAFVRLTPPALTVDDYFTMTNTVSESNGDVDLGSAGLMLLPPLNNAQGLPVSLVVGAGKDGNIYVLNQNNMGKYNPSMDAIYQLLPGALPSGTWSSPAWFNGVMYYGGQNTNLQAFTFTSGSFSLTSETSATFGFPGTTPSISANGAANGIVWATENTSPAVLHAYDATNLATELYNSNQASGGRDQFGSGNKFIAPTIANGKVYVGTTTGVGVFGLLSKILTPSLSITKSHTGTFAQGQQGATYTVTVSNTAGAAATAGTVTVTDTIPQGLTLAGMQGSGWTCASNSCTRGDSLAAGSSYPSITVMVNVASNAPSSVTNSVSVTGGGNPASKTATDPTIINSSQYTLTTNVSPGGAGSVTPASGGEYNSGSAVAIDATPDKGYKFVNWTGSAVANATRASTTITMNGPETVTANFVPEQTSFGFTVTRKSGPLNARAWDLTITNKGPGVANSAELTSFTLTQTAGAACQPVVATSFPASLGNLAPAGTKAITVTINFTGCAQSARFSVDAKFSADSGASTGSVVRTNQTE